MKPAGLHRAKRDSATFLPTLYARQHSLCFWCKSACVILRFIPQTSIVKQTHTHVTWQHGELTLTAKIASLEHIIPKREGPHAHETHNFVMACTECNNARTRTESPIPEPIRRVCPDCLGEKDIKRRKCRECFVRGQENWLIQNGWTQVPSYDPGYFMWVDPLTGEKHICKMACIVQQQRT